MSVQAGMVSGYLVMNREFGSSPKKFPDGVLILSDESAIISEVDISTVD
jgi:hypothetical protein